MIQFFGGTMRLLINLVKCICIVTITLLLSSCLEKQGKSSNEVIEDFQSLIDTLDTYNTDSVNAVSNVGPSLMYFADGASYQHEDEYASSGYFFQQDGKVIFTAASVEAVETNGREGMQVSTSGEYEINHDSKKIFFKNWDNILSPQGNVTYEIEGENIVGLVNGMGVRFYLNTNDGKYNSVKSEQVTTNSYEVNQTADQSVIVHYAEGRFESLGSDLSRWKEYKSVNSNVFDFILASEETDYYILQKVNHNLMIKLPKYGGMIYLSMDNGVNWSDFFSTIDR